MDNIRNVVIIGSGCAGHTAALYTARANLKPLVIEGHEAGGQLSLTTLVENFPGFPEGIQGPELIENMRKQAGRFGAQYQLGHVVGADLSKRPFAIDLGKETIHARTLIIASGASARWLGLPSEQALIGHGVSSCATCDGFFFSGKEIAVIGGGDSAMEEANFLTRFASKVTLIHRRDQFRASKIMLDRARQNKKINFLTNTVVEDVLDVSKKEVTGLKLRDLKTDKVRDFPTSAMFLGIGHIPNTRMFEGQLETDQDGYLVTTNNVFTRVRGFMPAATCRTAAIARRLLPQVRVAWRHWKRKGSWKSKFSRLLLVLSCQFGGSIRWHVHKRVVRTWEKSGRLNPAAPVARNVWRWAIPGSICGSASAAAMSGAVIPRRTSMPPNTSARANIPSSSRSSRARTGAGAMWMRYFSISRTEPGAGYEGHLPRSEED